MKEQKDIQLITDFLEGRLPSEEKNRVEERIKHEPDFAESLKLVEIQLFLEDNLPDPRREQFESKLTKDDSFKEEVEWNKKIQSDIKEVGDQKMKDELKVLLPRLSTEKIQEDQQAKAIPLYKTRGFKWGIVAACLIGVLVAAVLLIQRNTSPEDLFALHFEAYEMQIGVRGENDNKLLDQAIQYYEGKDFKEAAGKFQKLSMMDPNKAIYMLYTGISFLAAEEPEEAKTYFQYLIGDFNFNDQAEWYLALTYLKQGNTDGAKTIFSKIADDPQHTYHQKAASIIAKL